MSSDEDIKRIKGNSLAEFEKELNAEAKLVLSSYMKTDNLPENYRGIDEYVRETRLRLIKEIGGNPTQLQSILLDGICEVLILLKYVSTFIAENPEANIINFDRSGVPHPSEIMVKGFVNLHQTLDRKLKQFHEMSVGRGDAESASEIHRRAIMGEHIPTGRPVGKKKYTVRNGETGKFQKLDN